MSPLREADRAADVAFGRFQRQRRKRADVRQVERDGALRHESLVEREVAR